MEGKLKGNRRRRERAKKMRDELAINAKVSEDSCEEIPRIRVRPHKAKGGTKEPLFEEDFIDGFAVLSFASYEDLEKCLHAAGKGNSQMVNMDGKKYSGAHKVRPSLPKTAASIEYPIEDGYVCDGESDGDKISDADQAFYSPSADLVDKKPVSSHSISNIVLAKHHSSVDVPLSSTDIISSLQCDVSVPAQLNSCNKSCVTTADMSSSCVVTTTSTSDCPKLNIVKEEPSFSCHRQYMCEQNTSDVEKKYDLSSFKMNDDSMPFYIDKKYPILDDKTLIDKKPPLFSPINSCLQVSSNSALRSDINAVTTASIEPTNVTATITTTTSSMVNSANEQSVNHTSHSLVVSHSTASSKSKFTVSSLVSMTNSIGSHYIGSTDQPADPSSHLNIIRPQSVKSYPPIKSTIPLPVSKVNISNAHSSIKPMQLPIKCAVSAEASFATMSSDYSSPSLVPTSSQYPVYPHNKSASISSHTPVHNAVKIECREYSGKPSKIKPSQIFGPPPPSVCHSTFGVMNSPSPHLKTHPSLGGFIKREPITPTRPVTPHSNFASRYSPRLQDPHSTLYNSQSSLGSNRLSSFQRTSTAISSFPISAPLPPSGAFAPHPNVPTVMASGNSLGQDPLVAQADLLRRELDSRFLATQDRSAVSMATSSLGAVPTLLRTDVHHHQHQHTHVHQHLLPHLTAPIVPPATPGIFSHSSATPSLFKEVNKVGMESGLYHQRSDLGSFSSAISPLMPVNNSSLVPSPIAPVTKKSGQWNVMHVRIAWEIFYDQQKQARSKGMKLGSSADVLKCGPGMPSLYPNLARPNDQLSSMVGGGPMLEGSSFLGAQHITSSVPGFPYAAAPSHNCTFPNINQSNIGGAPPGSMFSRESTTPAVPIAAPVHDPWRIRAPVPFGNSSAPTWHHKTELSFFEKESREQKEQERRDQQEKERKKERHLRQEQERREEKEKREREEKKREREKRAEHEKERFARFEMYNDGGSFVRNESRSPLRDTKESRLPGIPSTHLKHGSRAVVSSSRYDSSKDEITIVGSKEGNRQQLSATASHLGPPVLPTSSSSFLGFHPLSSSLERARLFGSGYHTAPGHQAMAHWPDPLRDPYRTAQDPFAVARANDLSGRESLLSRDHLRDTLERAREDHLMRVNPLGTMILNERYREHHAAREIMERERHYAAAAAATIPDGFYSHHSIVPAHPSVSAATSLLPPAIKTGAPLGHPMVSHPSLHPQALAGLYPSTYLGHHSLAPGLPPPLIPSIPVPSQTMYRPLDKNDVPK